MRHIFIINTLAKEKEIAKVQKYIKELGAKYHLDYEIYLTKYAHHAKDLAKELSNSETIVYAVGGDGTIFEVLNGLDLQSTMAIIPLGSGNDFYRMIGPKDNLKLLIEKTINGIVKKIDFGKINEKRFLNCSSIGIDSKINFEASKLIHSKGLHKSPAYSLSIIKNMIAPKPFSLRIKIDDDIVLDKEFYIACIMNGSYYGNGAKPSPLSKLDDGYFNVILAYDVRRHEIYSCLLKYLKGKHLDDPRFHFYKAKKITIIAPSDVLGQSDGESEFAIKRELMIRERALKLLVPKDAYFLRSSS